MSKLKFTNRYRITRKPFDWFHAEVKYWWFPIMWFCIGYHLTVERCETDISSHRDHVVKYL